MAHVTTQSNRAGFGAMIGSAIGAVAEFFDAIFVANANIADLERLSGLSDETLANQYGIQRDEIVEYVFGHNRIG